MKKNLYDRYWFDANWIHKRTWGRYDKYGFDVNWIHKDTWEKTNPEGKTRDECLATVKIPCIAETKNRIMYSEEEWWINKKTKTKYNSKWYDRDWYNKEWFDSNWYDRKGYNKEWFNRDWYDSEGYDRDWFNKDWIDRNWYNRAMNMDKHHPFYQFYEKWWKCFISWDYKWCDCGPCIWMFIKSINKTLQSNNAECWGGKSNHIPKIDKDAIKTMFDWIDFNELNTAAKAIYKTLDDIKNIALNQKIRYNSRIWQTLLRYLNL